jgi:Ca-activated chloride channel homolog
MPWIDISVIHSFHFLRPAWGFSVIPAIIFMIIFIKYQIKQNAWDSVCDKHLLPYLLEGGYARKIAFSWIFLLSVILLLAIIAMMGPTFSYEKVPLIQKSIHRIILIDLSDNAMSADLKPSRLMREKYKLQDILHFSKEGDLGLIAYAGEAYVVSPLTSDPDIILGFINELSVEIMPVAGNNLSDALKLSRQLFQQAKVNQGEVIVLSSGLVDEHAASTAKALYESGYTVSIIGFASTDKAPLLDKTGEYQHDINGNILFGQYDENELKAVALSGGGIFIPMTYDSHDVNTLMNQYHLSKESQKKSRIVSKVWKDSGYYLVFFILLLFLCCFRPLFIEMISE